MAKDETLCCRHCNDNGAGGLCAHCASEGRGEVLHAPVTVTEGPDPEWPVTLEVTRRQADVLHTALVFARDQMKAWKLAAGKEEDRLMWGRRIREVRDLIRIVTE